jgi:hypothetical protein
MNAYQKLQEFLNAVEQMTGFRPKVDISFHSHYGFDDEGGEKIRSLLVADAAGELNSEEMPLGNDAQGYWTNYRARGEGIEISVHGPHKKEAPQCSA